MIIVAVDVAKDKHDCFITNTEGEVLFDPFVIPNTLEGFDSLFEKLRFQMTHLTLAKEKDLIRVKNSYVLQKPFQLLDKKSNRYLQILSKLETLSPLLTLQRGYTISKVSNKVVSSKKDVKKGDQLEVEFQDGTVLTEVL